MGNPPTLPEADGRGLIVDGKGIHTFSNGTAWDCWASGNCLQCAFYNLEGPAGEFCAFEAAAFLHSVSPELARMFGWAESEKYPGSFIAPDECRFFRQRPERGDDEDFPAPPPPPDPRQLVLIADPTEDAALITLTREIPAPAPIGQPA